MTPAPLHRVLDALSDEPAPPDPLDVDRLVRRGDRRRRVRRVAAGSVAVLAIAVVGSVGLGERHRSLTENEAANSNLAPLLTPLKDEPMTHGASQVRGALRPPADSGAVVHAESGALNDLVTITTPRAVISTGDIRLKDKDVDTARREVLAVVADLRGEVADEQNVSDKDGGLTSSSLVLRVPSGRFGAAMSRIGAIGTRVSTVDHSDDVTNKVVDTNARLRVQRASVNRIRALLAQAQSIRDIVTIEGQLSQREAALESLEAQRAQLANQTSLSTISVRVDRIPPKPSVTVKDGDGDAARHGFVGGLVSGWHALVTAGTAVAVAAGTALPWLAVLLLLGWPALVLARRLRRRWAASYS